MLERAAAFESITGNRPSVLRQEFERIGGDFVGREISVNSVTEDIRDIHERPGFTPRLTLIQTKILGGGEKIFFFHETIFTNNEFLTEVERNLRAGSDDVKAENFEDVPQDFIDHFRLSEADVITVDMEPMVDLDSLLTGTPKIVGARPKGIDFSEPITFRMIRPGLVSEMLSEIEKKGRFTSVIKVVNISDINDQRLVAFEYRNGTEHTTVDHFVFRRSNESGLE